METMYDQWLRNEKQKIRDKHEEIRKELNGEAFILGLSSDCFNASKAKQRNDEINKKLEVENAAEKAEIEEFMKLIDANWTSHVDDVMGNK